MARPASREHERRMRRASGERARRLWALLGATALILLLAYAIKTPCLERRWVNGMAYEERCYNDVQPLYAARGLDGNAFPYVGHGGERTASGDPLGFVEYPALTGLLMWAESFGAHDRPSFFKVNALVMAGLALATSLCLWAFRTPPRRLLLWGLGPPLALYAYHNWDLLAVFLATAGLLAFLRERPALSGALLALGAMSKLYPALFLAVLGCELLRREGGLGRQGWRFALAAVGVLVALNAPFAVWNLLHPNPDPDPANANLWLKTYTFHLDREVNLETPWFVAWRAARDGGHLALADALRHDLPKAAGLGMLAGLGATCWLTWRGRIAWPQACFAALLLFLLLNKVFSVQYALWVLPFLALLDLPWPARAAFLVSDFLVFLTVWPYLLGRLLRTDPEFWPLGLAVLLRFAALAWLLVLVLRRPLGLPFPEPKPRRAPSPEPAPVPQAG